MGYTPEFYTSQSGFDSHLGLLTEQQQKIYNLSALDECSFERQTFLLLKN